MSYRDMLVKEGPFRWMIPPRYQNGDRLANVPVYFYGNKAIIGSLEEGVFEQAVNTANLPRIKHYSNTEDGHIGADCSIGATIAFDGADGHVAPTLVGSDIACGMRVILTNLTAADVTDKATRRALMEAIEKRVPCGIGVKSLHKLTHDEYIDVLERGAYALNDMGYIDVHDLSCLEQPCMDGDHTAASQRAVSRGFDTIGTLGGGNHFIEIQIVDHLGDETLAAQWGLSVGQVVVMVHTGSRGFGFQVNKNYTEELKQFREMWDMTQTVPFMPIKSDIGKRYFNAQACSVNFAVASKTLITHSIYEAFAEVFNTTRESLGMRVLYDLMHNVARFEHDGKQSHLVIRKGATRALPAGHHMNPKHYRETGHPVLIPGSMGTYSYILVGKEGGADNFYTVPHGAGRVMSRGQARKTIDVKAFKDTMDSKDILVNAREFRQVLDEAPAAYKDIDEIIESVEGSGRAGVVAKLRPVAVIKGAED